MEITNLQINEEKEKRRLQLVEYYRVLSQNAVKDNHREYAKVMLDAFENNKPVPHTDIYGNISVSAKRDMYRITKPVLIYCEETDKTYKSISACAKELKVSTTTISTWINKPEAARYRLYKIDSEMKSNIDG